MYSVVRVYNYTLYSVHNTLYNCKIIAQRKLYGVLHIKGLDTHSVKSRRYLSGYQTILNNKSPMMSYYYIVSNEISMYV